METTATPATITSARFVEAINNHDYFDYGMADNDTMFEDIQFGGGWVNIESRNAGEIVTRVRVFTNEQLANDTDPMIDIDDAAIIGRTWEAITTLINGITAN